MTVYVELELTAYLLGIDYDRHIVSSFIEQCQYSLVNIVVDKNDTSFCTLNQVGHESIGIINLPIVEHTLLRFCIAFVQSAEYFFYTLVGFLQVLLHFQLMVFHSRETLKHFGIVL